MHSVPKHIWEKANCQGHDTELFYPDRDANTYGTVAGEAKRICRGDADSPACPVLLECLFYGLVTEDDFGIWGGMSVRERNALRRHRSLDKYKPARPYAGTRYYRLIENYLEQHDDEEIHGEGKESEEADEPTTEGMAGRREGRVDPAGSSSEVPSDAP